MTAEIRIGHLLQQSEIYGPGLRYVIWVQGCTLACKGCWNKQFWSSQGGEAILVEELIEKISAIPDIEGITLLGGEPLQQAEAVLELIMACKEKDLTVFLYTGYELEEFDQIMQKCFDSSDIVVSGRYVQSLRDTNLRWRGSQNQSVHFISSRYDPSICQEQNEVECHIMENGMLTIVGYAGAELLSAVKSWV